MLHFIEHSLLAQKITLLRDRNTVPQVFKKTLEDVALMLAYEASRDLERVSCDVFTPLAATVGEKLKNPVVIVPILRAGLGMSAVLADWFDGASTGHIGLYRDSAMEQPIHYYSKFPMGIEDATVFLVDPMLATGGSAVKALDIIKERGVKRIKLLSVVASTVGVDRVVIEHPDVDIYCGVVDEELNNRDYIIPGLGDAGDRLFGTV